jgi:anti-sigma factor RsiW
MHAVVMESLEDYLAGTLEPAGQRGIEAHLSSCPACREEIQSMQEVSQLFGSLRSEESWEPSPAFYAGVVRQAEARRVPSFSSLFGLDLAFGRRVVFASLLTLAILGSYLVTREAEYPAGGPSPDVVMAQQNSPYFDSDAARDKMLVTLTAYEQH